MVCVSRNRAYLMLFQAILFFKWFVALVISIGEIARLRHGYTLLHRVPLGRTGKAIGDQHPKIRNHVLIGANVSVLGNILVGSNAKIGAGSILQGATVVRSPVKITGRMNKGGARLGVIWI